MENIKSALLQCRDLRRRLFHPKKPNQDGLSLNGDRYEACRLLAEKGVCSVIWLEDLLALHGSDTQVWDLHLLVEDPCTAANVLLDRGYKKIPPDLRFEHDPEFSKRAIRAIHPQSSTSVALQSASEWYYQIDEGVQDFLPPLHSFLDSMIEFWLNISSQDYVDRLGFALYVACLIGYCYYLQTSEGKPVKDPAYAENLKPEHREVHYNIVSTDPKEENFTTTSQHIYHVRRSKEIKEGTFVPKPYEKGAFRVPLTTVSE